jgi:NADPH:quinone reductase-like Zn-dependent oxidoreductase
MAVKAAYAKGGAGIEAVQVRETPMPEPGPGEVLVRLTAATLNFRDLLFSKGVLQNMTKQPEYVPLSCAVGEVAALGAGVEGFKRGERVSPTFVQGVARSEGMSAMMLGGSADGVARTHAVFPAISLCKVPDQLGDLEAATLPCAGLTAWSALFTARPIQAGEWVLVQGTGGVSLAALQWAKAAGAKVVLTSSSDAKLRRGAALGADVTINYKTHPDWAKASRAKLGGEGVDIVIDVAGAQDLSGSAAVLNDGGIIAAIGMLGGEFSWGKDIGKTIVPIAVGSPDQHDEMLAFAAKHRIRPVVDVVYDLDRIQDALKRLESGAFFGKVGVNLL